MIKALNLNVLYNLAWKYSLQPAVFDADNSSVTASGPTSDYTAIFCSKPRLVRSPPPQTVAR